MNESFVDIINIRRMVFAEIARLAYYSIDLSLLGDSTYRLLPGEEARYRDSIFKERAVIGERLRLALGLPVRDASESGPLSEGIDEGTIVSKVYEAPLVNVIPFACEACPDKTYTVSDNCRKCLAHPCVPVCPVNAVSIEKTAAVIDQEKCIKCGRCEQACPYNAILHYDRPCAAACGVNAIESDYLNRATIVDEKCVACGRCIQECPFGAIADKSQIYQLIRSIMEGEEVTAIIAPSFVGQFGALTKPAQIIEAIKVLGFKQVVEVGLGADLTTINEAREYLHEVPEHWPFMGTSCCYSWANMVEKNFPDEAAYISDSATPMIYTAQYLKKTNPDAKICFIGPCVSKKLEAIEGRAKGHVDYVITFEELMGMLVASNIEPSELDVSYDVEDASETGRAYAGAGGVADAVAQMIKELKPEAQVQMEAADNLFDCVKMMKIAKAGKRKGYLLEGMACPGGCVGGPGTLVMTSKGQKSVNAFAKASPYRSPSENEKIAEERQQL